VQVGRTLVSHGFVGHLWQVGQEKHIKELYQICVVGGWLVVSLTWLVYYMMATNIDSTYHTMFVCWTILIVMIFAAALTAGYHKEESTGKRGIFHKNDKFPVQTGGWKSCWTLKVDKAIN